MPGNLASLVGDLRQVASVRRIVLDDGAERGVRALAFSTGGGLDFWVLSDRSLDIGPLWWCGTQLAWQAPGGFRSPALTDPDGDGGYGFNRSFSGFLVTCGLDHIRQPANGHPLHGRLPFTPARLTAYGEEWAGYEPVLFCEGEVLQARIGGEALRLRRRIEAPIGGSTVRIRDEVENLGAEPSPQAILYHFNLGFPSIAPGAVVHFGERIVLGPIAMPASGHPQPAVTFPSAGRHDARAIVRTPAGGQESLDVAFEFDGTTLPHLQIWHDLRPRTGILAIEPCTSARNAAGRSAPELILEPGERRAYAIQTTISGRADPFSQASKRGQA